MMRVSAEQQANAAVRSVEAKKKTQQAATVVDWDAAIARFKVMMADMYDRK